MGHLIIELSKQQSIAYVTRPGKTDHLGTFIVLRSVNLNNSLSYNSAVVNSRGMEIAMEIQHLFSFK